MIFFSSEAQFFSLGGRRGTSTIISFNFINIRHHLGVLLIVDISKIIWAAKDLLWPWGLIFYIVGQVEVPKSYSPKKSQIQEYYPVQIINIIFASTPPYGPQKIFCGPNAQIFFFCWDSFFCESWEGVHKSSGLLLPRGDPPPRKIEINEV